MQTGYIMPRPKGTPRRLLHFLGSGHKANISHGTRSLVANPNPTSGLETNATGPVATPPSTQALEGGGATHLH